LSYYQKNTYVANYINANEVQIKLSLKLPWLLSPTPMCQSKIKKESDAAKGTIMGRGEEKE